MTIKKKKDQNKKNEVREPDKIKKERLIDFSYTPYIHDGINNEEELEYQKAVQESILLAEQIEEKQVKELIEKSTHRKLGTKNIMIILKRLSLLDNNVDAINKIIEPILNSYNECSIDNYNFDKETHVKIFDLLKTIRFTELEKKLLETIFITE